MYRHRRVNCPCTDRCIADAGLLGLGSVTELTTTVILIAMLVLRLLDEENLLRAELPGYVEY